MTRQRGARVTFDEEELVRGTPVPVSDVPSVPCAVSPTRSRMRRELTSYVGFRHVLADLRAEGSPPAVLELAERAVHDEQQHAARGSNAEPTTALDPNEPVLCGCAPIAPQVTSAPARAVT